MSFSGSNTSPSRWGAKSTCRKLPSSKVSNSLYSDKYFTGSLLLSLFQQAKVFSYMFLRVSALSSCGFSGIDNYPTLAASFRAFDPKFLTKGQFELRLHYGRHEESLQ